MVDFFVGGYSELSFAAGPSFFVVARLSLLPLSRLLAMSLILSFVLLKYSLFFLGQLLFDDGCLAFLRFLRL